MATRGEKHPNAQLTEAQVRAIRRLHNEKFWKITCIATAYKVSHSTIYDIVHNITWIHVKPKEKK